MGWKLTRSHMPLWEGSFWSDRREGSLGIGLRTADAVVCPVRNESCRHTRANRAPNSTIFLRFKVQPGCVSKWQYGCPEFSNNNNRVIRGLYLHEQYNTKRISQEFDNFAVASVKCQKFSFQWKCHSEVVRPPGFLHYIYTTTFLTRTLTLRLTKTLRTYIKLRVSEERFYFVRL